MSAKAKIQRQRTGMRLSVESHVGCAAVPQTGVDSHVERKCKRNRFCVIAEPVSVYTGEDKWINYRTLH